MGHCLAALVFRFQYDQYQDTTQVAVYLLVISFVATVKCLSPMQFQQNLFLVTPCFFITVLAILVPGSDLEILPLIFTLVFVMMLVAVSNGIKYRAELLHYLQNVKIM